MRAFDAGHVRSTENVHETQKVPSGGMRGTAWHLLPRPLHFILVCFMLLTSAAARRELSERSGEGL